MLTLPAGRALQGVVRERASLRRFRELSGALGALYFRSFVCRQRRRLLAGPTHPFEDDGLLGGESIEAWVTRGRGTLDLYLDGGALVGFMHSINLDGASLGDYLALSPERKDLAGLGRRMLAAWLAEADARNEDAVVELEPPGTERIRRRRWLMFQRAGFTALDDVDYALPSGESMLIAVRPRPSRRAAFGVRPLSSSERADLFARVASTYRLWPPETPR